MADLSIELAALTLERWRRTHSRALNGIDLADVHGGLRRIRAITEEGLPTLGGYLALGASPQQESPHLADDVVVHPGTEKARDPSIRFLGAEPAAPTITVGCGPGLMASPPGTWNQDRSRPRATVAP